jgi:hypothetical protein
MIEHNDNDEHSMTEVATEVGMEVSQGSVVATEEELLRANAWSLLAQLLGGPPDEQMLSLLAEIDADKVDSDDLIGAAWRMLGLPRVAVLPPNSSTSTRTCSSVSVVASWCPTDPGT